MMKDVSDNSSHNVHDDSRPQHQQLHQQSSRQQNEVLDDEHEQQISAFFGHSDEVTQSLPTELQKEQQQHQQSLEQQHQHSPKQQQQQQTEEHHQQRHQHRRSQSQQHLLSPTLSSPLPNGSNKSPRHLRKRSCMAVLRDHDEIKPMAWDDRLLIQVKKAFTVNLNNNDNNTEIDDHHRGLIIPKNNSGIRLSYDDDAAGIANIMKRNSSKKLMIDGSSRALLKYGDDSIKSKDSSIDNKNRIIFDPLQKGLSSSSIRSSDNERNNSNQNSSSNNNTGHYHTKPIHEQQNEEVKDDNNKTLDNGNDVIVSPPPINMNGSSSKNINNDNNNLDQNSNHSATKKRGGWLKRLSLSHDQISSHDEPDANNDNSNDDNNDNNNNHEEDNENEDDDPLLNQSNQALINRPFKKNKYSLSSFFHWTFRVNFLILFTLMSIGFFSFVILFAGLITIGGNMDPKCIVIGGSLPFNNASAPFSDAFTLSWTTFSTVGYGSAAPALGYQNNNPSNCAYITTVVSFESFMGILFSGFCGAILFGKVLRIQSHAQVIFSDPIVIRYGIGAIISDEHINGGDEVNNVNNVIPKQLPFPVLEFRIINLLYNEDDGEIMDATLNVVAKIEELDQANISIMERRNSQHLSMNNNKNNNTYQNISLVRRLINSTGSMLSSNSNDLQQRDSSTTIPPQNTCYNNSRKDSINNNDPEASNNSNFGQNDNNKNRPASFVRRVRNRMSSLKASDSLFPDESSRSQQQNRKNNNPIFACAASGDAADVGRNVYKKNDGDNSRYRNNSSRSIRQSNSTTHLYYKMMIETPDHPFFKRVWVARHVLDESSPLLEQRVKDMIRHNNNEWPYHKLNTADDIRNSLSFTDILVSLNGISNISASSVYAQKIYDYFDVNIGYQFVNVLYRELHDRSVGVDTDLINDVCEQNGGGGEPLV